MYSELSASANLPEKAPPSLQSLAVDRYLAALAHEQSRNPNASQKFGSLIEVVDVNPVLARLPGRFSNLMKERIMELDSPQQVLRNIAMLIPVIDIPQEYAYFAMKIGDSSYLSSYPREFIKDLQQRAVALAGLYLEATYVFLFSDGLIKIEKAIRLRGNVASRNITSGNTGEVSRSLRCDGSAYWLARVNGHKAASGWLEEYWRSRNRDYVYVSSHGAFCHTLAVASITEFSTFVRLFDLLKEISPDLSLFADPIAISLSTGSIEHLGVILDRFGGEDELCLFLSKQEAEEPGYYKKIFPRILQTGNLGYIMHVEELLNRSGTASQSLYAFPLHPLAYACKSNNLAVVKRVIASDTFQETRDLRDEILWASRYYEGPVVTACRHGNKAIIECLFSHLTNEEVVALLLRDSSGMNSHPIFPVVTLAGNFDLFEYLLAKIPRERQVDTLFPRALDGRRRGYVLAHAMQLPSSCIACLVIEAMPKEEREETLDHIVVSDPQGAFRGQAGEDLRNVRSAIREYWRLLDTINGIFRRKSLGSVTSAELLKFFEGLFKLSCPKAADRVLHKNRLVLIAAMSYRLGGKSPVDGSSTPDSQGAALVLLQYLYQHHSDNVMSSRELLDYLLPQEKSISLGSVLEVLSSQSQSIYCNLLVRVMNEPDLKEEVLKRLRHKEKYEDVVLAKRKACDFFTRLQRRIDFAQASLQDYYDSIGKNKVFADNKGGIEHLVQRVRNLFILTRAAEKLLSTEQHTTSSTFLIFFTGARPEEHVLSKYKDISSILDKIEKDDPSFVSEIKKPLSLSELETIGTLGRSLSLALAACEEQELACKERNEEKRKEQERFKAFYEQEKETDKARKRKLKAKKDAKVTFELASYTDQNEARAARSSQAKQKEDLVKKGEKRDKTSTLLTSATVSSSYAVASSSQFSTQQSNSSKKISGAAAVGACTAASSSQSQNCGQTTEDFDRLFNVRFSFPDVPVHDPKNDQTIRFPDIPVHEPDEDNQSRTKMKEPPFSAL